MAYLRYLAEILTERRLNVANFGKPGTHNHIKSIIICGRMRISFLFTRKISKLLLWLFGFWQLRLRRRDNNKNFLLLFSRYVNAFSRAHYFQRNYSAFYYCSSRFVVSTDRLITIMPAWKILQTWPKASVARKWLNKLTEIRIHSCVRVQNVLLLLVIKRRGEV